MGKVLYNKETGEAAEYEGVDAREILTNSPDLYTDVPPNGADPLVAPRNEADVHNEFAREPVGNDPPAQGDVETVIRNPVTDKPQTAEPPDGQDDDADDDLDGMKVAELKAAIEAKGGTVEAGAKKADLVDQLAKLNA